MKRNRICCFDFDTRANILDTCIKDDWEDEVKLQWQTNMKKIESEIIQEFGTLNAKEKIKRFKEIGAKPFSIIAYHNFLLNQIRDSYVQGAYYPALTSACTLGERILNHLIIDLREFYQPKLNIIDKIKKIFRKSSAFNIYTCKSCTNWNLMITTLKKWGIFLNNCITKEFKKLSKKRHKSIHFTESTIKNLESESLETIKILQKIIQLLFSAVGNSQYFILAKGEVYLKKELESNPFFLKYYLPNCKLVSPFHKVKKVMPQFIIEDASSVEDKEITDEEFIKLREAFQKKQNTF